MFTLTRLEHNPILSPVKEHPWESLASFNGCPIMEGDKMYMIYRAMSEPDPMNEPHISTSSIAIASSVDGINFKERQKLFGPSEDWDKFGCEDPRVTKIDGTYYIFYTALGNYPFDAGDIKVAVAVSDDLKTIKEKHLVTHFNAKAMVLFPEKINGKLAGLLTIDTDRRPSDICYIEFDKPEDMWSEEYWEKWKNNLIVHRINLRRKDNDQVEMGAPPVKTDKGWLVVYSHIQNYGQQDVIFGIEIVLLDLLDPRRVVGRTHGSFMTPEAYYEKLGHVFNIIFPTGALIKGDKLEIYYGASDTHCAVAYIYLDVLLDALIDFKELPPEAQASRFKRFAGNPIISPRKNLAWEAGGTINPAGIFLNDEFHIVYRATSSTNLSVLGYARSKDGLKIDERLAEPIYIPRADFEKKENSNDNFGCEDPRIVQIGDTLYMNYTAYDGITPRVAVSSIKVNDFLNKKWSEWSEPYVITPPKIPNKDSVIFPEKIDGKYMIMHRAGNSICADFVSSLDFSKEKITRCIEIVNPQSGMWDGEKVGIAGPPIKTEEGWLLLYHGVSRSRKYRVGAVLLELENPTIVKARTALPIFEPEESYEINGLIPNVVFPCSLIEREGKIYIYYGAGDSVIGVATMMLKDLLYQLRT